MWVEISIHREGNEVGYISYDTKNGIKYAKLCFSKRRGKNVSKTYKNLGRVIDSEKHIFRNRELGVYMYNPESGTISSPDASVILPTNRGAEQEKLILDFGDSYFLDEFIKQDGLCNVINSINYRNRDTLWAMLHYYILCSTSNSHAEDWWEGSYARILYPRANLVSQRISEFLSAIGEEHTLRIFFGAYIPYISTKANRFSDILIDSTGLPNSIHFPLTAVSNHNGDISSEVRLIYVVQQETGLPIYFRYVAGNIVDVSTLIRTIAELKANGVNTKFAILDAGYYSEDNARKLISNGVSFISRLGENLRLYKNLIEEHLETIQSEENLIEYNGRYIFVKRVQCTLFDSQSGYAYVCLDIERKSSETQKLFKRAGVQKISRADVYRSMSAKGVFVLVSTRKIASDKILPLYYTRQQIEQIFDIGKNYTDMIPIRVQSEDTFRGHLLLTFIASVIVKRIQDRLKNTPHSPISMFINLRNQKCKVYDNSVITQEANRKVNDYYRIFSLKPPVELPIQCG
ncbi:MAG: transposase [Rickettsiales bacterium]|jgi:hypothetical protein|nr:transposase [Rickettsiales bacterium]